MRRAFVHCARSHWAAGRRSLARSFARQIRPVPKKFDLDKLVINDSAVVYRQELDSDRDFFYQEMISLATAEEVLAFYTQKQEQFDGLGIKLVIQELLKRSSGGQIPKRKPFETLVNENQAAKHRDVVQILDQRTGETLNNLDYSYLVELIEMVSKYGLVSEQFTLLVIKKFLLKAELASNQFIYELLLRCVTQDSEAYPIILEMLEEDLTRKKFEVKDPVVALSLLDNVLSFRGDKMKLVRQLEYYLDESTKGKMSEEVARQLLKIYSDSGFRSPNLELLDKVAAILILVVPKRDVQYLRDLLKDMAAVGAEDFTLLSALSRRLFDLLVEKAVSIEKMTDQAKEEELSEEEEDDKEPSADDEESLEAITFKLFGKQGLEALKGGNLAEGETATLQEPTQEVFLEEELTWLPEILYYLVKLNVDDLDIVLQR